MGQLAGTELHQQHFDDALAHIGIALEHLAKAVLVQADPLLIVGSDGAALDTAGMLWALGRPAKGVDGPRRTITATEAVRRCLVLIPDLDMAEVRPVLDARNGVLHIADAGGSAGAETVGRGARAVKVLLRELDKDPVDFWGHWHHAISAFIEQRRTEVERRVQLRLASASDQRELMLRRYGPTADSALRDLASNRMYSDHEAPVPCPVCRANAFGRGSVFYDEVPDVDVEDGHGYVSGVTMVPYLELSGFKCSVCGLVLNGIEEIQAAGVPAQVPSEGVEPGPWE